MTARRGSVGLDGRSTEYKVLSTEFKQNDQGLGRGVQLNALPYLSSLWPRCLGGSKIECFPTLERAR